MSDPEDALRALADAANDDAPAQPPPPTKPPAAPQSNRPESPIAKHPPAPPPPTIARPEAPPTAEQHTELDELSLASVSALAELSGATSTAYDPAGSSQARRRRLTKPDTSMMQFRAVATPILITVGLLMLGLGVWGLMVKSGNTTLPMADRPDAGNYALLALVGLPLGLLLIAGAGFFLYQLSQDKKKLQEYEEARAAQRRG